MRNRKRGRIRDEQRQYRTKCGGYFCISRGEIGIISSMKALLKKNCKRHLLGSVTDNKSAPRFISRPTAAFFKIKPEAVVYPRNTADVRKTVRYAGLPRRRRQADVRHQPRRRHGPGRRGPLAPACSLVFPAHMNRLLAAGQKHRDVQPGINYAALQQTLKTHGRYLPAGAGQRRLLHARRRGSPTTPAASCRSSTARPATTLTASR